MANLTIRRRKTRKQRAVSAVGKAGSAVVTFLKARVAWLMGKKAAKVAVPAAAAAGTAAVVARKRFNHSHEEEQARTAGVNAAQPTTPAGVV